MKTEYIGGKRTLLKNELPLDMPYTLDISVIQGVCNLKCEYCEQAIGGFGTGVEYLSVDIIRKIIEDMKRAGWFLKQILLGGGGEPLLHPEIMSIIKDIATAKIAADVVLVTNGTLLNRKICDELLESGLTTLRISLNGISDEDYKKYASAEVDFSKLLRNIEYLYNNKFDMKIYVKIMNYMIAEPDLEQRFFGLFDPISDYVGIENVMELTSGIDYSNMQFGLQKNLHGASRIKFEVCPIPLYAMTLHTSGKVCACCQAAIWEKTPQLVFGDVREESIFSIWKGKKRAGFLQNNLKEGRIGNKLCSRCEACDMSSYKEDSVDDVRNDLLCKYNFEG